MAFSFKSPLIFLARGWGWGKSNAWVPAHSMQWGTRSLASMRELVWPRLSFPATQMATLWRGHFQIWATTKHSFEIVLVHGLKYQLVGVSISKSWGNSLPSPFLPSPPTLQTKQHHLLQPGLLPTPSLSFLPYQQSGAFKNVNQVSMCSGSHL